ncbi:hypothetical protein UPYG_G00203350 [Umbra pygmaea]|uniref:Secreted protein n=1 Tax=Umbra pygmaea TaxID=75934 RepID=A0ABD0WIQ5_UMBPY
MYVGGLCQGVYGVGGCPLGMVLLGVWCFCLRLGGEGAWVVAVSSDEAVPGVSVPVVLFPTDAGAGGAADDGATEGAKPAPTSEHDDDNSLGYTGTATSPVTTLISSKSVCLP